MTEKPKFLNKKFATFADATIANAHPCDLAVLAELCRNEIDRQTSVVKATLAGSSGLPISLVAAE
jgi:hypothetical protein